MIKRGCLILVVMFCFVTVALAEDLPVPPPAAILPPEQQQALDAIITLYQDNLVCSDTDAGVEYAVAGSAQQSIETNLLESIVFFFQRLFQGISADEVDEALKIMSGDDNCAFPSEKEVSLSQIEALQRYGDKLWLREQSCAGQLVQQEFYQCPFGCHQGRCLAEDESQLPQRAITWLLLTENVTSINTLNVPTGVIFVQTQQEYDDLTNPNILAPRDKTFPLFYQRYPVFTIDHREESGLINVALENMNVNRSAIKLETGETVDLNNLYRFTNANGNLIIVYKGVLAPIQPPSDEKQPPAREYWAERRQAWGFS